MVNSGLQVEFWGTVYLIIYQAVEPLGEGVWAKYDITLSLHKVGVVALLVLV